MAAGYLPKHSEGRSPRDAGSRASGELQCAFLVDTLLDDLHRKEQATKKRQRLLLVLDEAGQWIGDDGDRLAQLRRHWSKNPQSKVWDEIFLIVTTHGDMGSIYKEARAVEGRHEEDRGPLPLRTPSPQKTSS